MSLKKDLDKLNPRKEQNDVISFIDAQYKKDKKNKFFLLNLPPGVGKSHLAMMIVDWCNKNIGSNSRFDIITNSKILQDQYSSFYDSINDLKGKDNYECPAYSCSCAQGFEFNRLNKTACDACPHTSAREGFLSGKISLTNFYLYILYQLYMPKLMESRNANVLIVDECHDLDSVISDFISIKITEYVVKKLKFSSEADIIKRLKKVSSISEYITFLESLKNDIYNTIDSIESALGSDKRSAKSDKRDNKLSKIFGSKNADTKIDRKSVV